MEAEVGRVRLMQMFLKCQIMAQRMGMRILQSSVACIFSDTEIIMECMRCDSYIRIVTAFILTHFMQRSMRIFMRNICTFRRRNRKAYIQEKLQDLHLMMLKPGSEVARRLQSQQEMWCWMIVGNQENH